MFGPTVHRTLTLPLRARFRSTRSRLRPSDGLGRVATRARPTLEPAWRMHSVCWISFSVLLGNPFYSQLGLKMTKVRPPMLMSCSGNPTTKKTVFVTFSILQVQHSARFRVLQTTGVQSWTTPKPAPWTEKTPQQFSFLPHECPTIAPRPISRGDVLLKTVVVDRVHPLPRRSKRSLPKYDPELTETILRLSLNSLAQGATRRSKQRQFSENLAR